MKEFVVLNKLPFTIFTRIVSYFVKLVNKTSKSMVKSRSLFEKQRFSISISAPKPKLLYIYKATNLNNLQNLEKYRKMKLKDFLIKDLASEAGTRRSATNSSTLTLPENLLIFSTICWDKQSSQFQMNGFKIGNIMPSPKHDSQTFLKMNKLI